jgi:hypothetical protein
VFKEDLFAVKGGPNLGPRQWCSSSTMMLVWRHLGGGVEGCQVLAGGVIVASRAGCAGLFSG